jgi:hypothetical protein
VWVDARFEDRRPGVVKNIGKEGVGNGVVEGAFSGQALVGLAMPELGLFGLSCKDKSRIRDPFVVGGVVAIEGYGDARFREDGAEILA